MKEYKNKILAFLLHLILSTLVFAVTFLFLFKYWYPEPFFNIDGGWRGVKIIALVDLVVGPFLTLILYKKGKKGLSFDLTIIALLQFIFLGYGVHTLYKFRPIALVYYGDQFYSLDAEKYHGDKNATRKILSIAGEIPAYIYIELPDNDDEVKSLRRQALVSGKSLVTSIEFYNNYKLKGYKVPPFGRNLEELFKIFPEYREKVEMWLDLNNGTINDFSFIPVNAKFQRSILAVDIKTGAIKGNIGIYLPYDVELGYKSFSK